MAWLSFAIAILQFIVWVLNRAKSIVRKRSPKSHIDGAEHEIRIAIGRLRERIRNYREAREMWGN